MINELFGFYIAARTDVKQTAASLPKSAICPLHYLEVFDLHRRMY